MGGRTREKEDKKKGTKRQTLCSVRVWQHLESCISLGRSQAQEIDIALLGI